MVGRQNGKVKYGILFYKKLSILIVLTGPLKSGVGKSYDFYLITWIDNVVLRPYWTPTVPSKLTNPRISDIHDKAKKTQVKAQVDKIALYPQRPLYTSSILSGGTKNTPEIKMFLSKLRMPCK